MKDERPNPDRLLRQAQVEERHESHGKLKIYLGAAPGVGKTYEMLHDAIGEQIKNLNILVGVVESHGRREVEEMLKAFEVLPKLTIEYHGKQLLEFDLDAALRRHPGLIILDEMAHSNVPGSRHKKRWQDIKELLDRGIDVYTTLNVQHIESLVDDVAHIIHAPIKETVPDFMIEMADTIELVDIPPEELLQRLREGKVYIPEQAKIAAERYFQKGNLTALRELALRTTANRVGVEVLLYRQGHGIKHIWPTKEKILVCVGSGASSLKLIRAAKNLASKSQSEWMAVYVDQLKSDSYDEERNNAIQNLRFAEQLGAQTRVLHGFDVTNEIMLFAREQNITVIMVWKHIRNRWRNIFIKSLADEIVRKSGEIDVYIMTGTREERRKAESSFYVKDAISWLSYGLCVFVVFLITFINFFLFSYLSTSNLIINYFLGVTVLSLLGKTGPTILATILSVLFCDYFFIPPYNSFNVTNYEYLFTLSILVVVPQVITYLSIRIRRQIEAARLTESRISALYTLSRQMAMTRGINKLLNTGISYIGSIFDSEVIALMPQNDYLDIVARYGTNQQLDEKEQGVAQWVFEMGQLAGFGTDTLSFSDALYLPLLGSEGVIGVLRIHPNQPDRFVVPEQMHLLEACANQIALAIEVDRLHEQNKK